MTRPIDYLLFDAFIKCVKTLLGTSTVSVTYNLPVEIELIIYETWRLKELPLLFSHGTPPLVADCYPLPLLVQGEVALQQPQVVACPS